MCTMMTSKHNSFQWIVPWMCAIFSMAFMSWECSAQGGFSDPTYGIVIDLSNYSVTLNTGDTLSVNATYTSTPTANYVIWFKGNTQIYVNQPTSGVGGRLVILPPITIRDVNCGDAGEYVLFVNNSRGQHYSSPLSVYVIIPADQPVANPQNGYCLYAPICRSLIQTNLFLEEGRSLTLTVDITTNTGMDSVEWFFNGDLVNRTDPRYQNGDADNPSLFIQSANRRDTGSYTVFANNTIGPLRSSDCTFNITVGYPPETDCGCNSTQCHVVNETESCYFPVNSIDAVPPVTRVQWFKGDNLVNNNTLSGRLRGGSIVNPSLTVFNTNRNDSGNYSVIVGNSIGDRTSCQCCCIVQFRPSCVLNFPYLYNVTEGNSFTMSVTLTALPPLDFLDWALNSTPLNRTGTRYVGGNTATPSLTVRQIHRNDAGLYVLISNNTVGEMIDTDCRVNITVYYRPLCTRLSNATLVYNEFSTFTIDVALDSIPPAHTVVWLRNGVPVNRAGGRFVNGNSYNVPSLTFVRATKEETGIYVIDAINIVGSIVESVRCTVNVTILYKPECPNGCARNYTICEDAPVTMECIVDALPPIDSVTWRKDGLALNVSDPRYDGGNILTPSLTIHSAVPGDRAGYECAVGNVVGSLVYQIYLNVLSKPSVSVTRTNIVLIEGQSSSLGCSVDMRTNPPPVVVHWFKNGFRIDSPRGRFNHGDINVPSLTINNIHREDAGVYSCGAVNSIGERHSRNIIVTVEYPPVVTAKYTNYGVPLYTSATLRCSVEANPTAATANITWIRDSLFQLPSTSCSEIRPNLQLCTLDVAVGGVYMCRASHKLATRLSEDIHVNIRNECPVVLSNVRLADGTADNSGRVEVQIGTTWGTVCGKYWTSVATEIVCRMFGYHTGISGLNGAGTGPIHIGHVACDQSATTLNDCGLTTISNCTHQEDIWVECGSSLPTTTTTTTTTTVATTTVAETTVMSVTSEVVVTTTPAPTTTTMIETTTTAAVDIPTTCPSAQSVEPYLITIAVLGTLLGALLILNIIFFCCSYYQCQPCQCIFLRSEKRTRRIRHGNSSSSDSDSDDQSNINSMFFMDEEKRKKKQKKSKHKTSKTDKKITTIQNGTDVQSHSQSESKTVVVKKSSEKTEANTETENAVTATGNEKSKKNNRSSDTKSVEEDNRRRDTENTNETESRREQKDRENEERKKLKQKETKVVQGTWESNEQRSYTDQRLLVTQVKTGARDRRRRRRSASRDRDRRKKAKHARESDDSSSEDDKSEDRRRRDKRPHAGETDEDSSEFDKRGESNRGFALETTNLNIEGREKVTRTFHGGHQDNLFLIITDERREYDNSGDRRKDTSHGTRTDGNLSEDGIYRRSDRQATYQGLSEYNQNIVGRRSLTTDDMIGRSYVGSNLQQHLTDLASDIAERHESNKDVTLQKTSTYVDLEKRDRGRFMNENAYDRDDNSVTLQAQSTELYRETQSRNKVTKTERSGRKDQRVDHNNLDTEGRQKKSKRHQEADDGLTEEDRRNGLRKSSDRSHADEVFSGDDERGKRRRKKKYGVLAKRVDKGFDEENNLSDQVLRIRSEERSKNYTQDRRRIDENDRRNDRSRSDDSREEIHQSRHKERQVRWESQTESHDVSRHRKKKKKKRCKSEESISDRVGTISEKTIYQDHMNLKLRDIHQREALYDTRSFRALDSPV